MGKPVDRRRRGGFVAGDAVLADNESLKHEKDQPTCFLAWVHTRSTCVYFLSTFIWRL